MERGRRDQKVGIGEGDQVGYIYSRQASRPASQPGRDPCPLSGSTVIVRGLQTLVGRKKPWGWSGVCLDWMGGRAGYAHN